MICNRGDFVGFQPDCWEKATHYVSRYFGTGPLEERVNIISHECREHAMESMAGVSTWATAPLKRAA